MWPGQGRIKAFVADRILPGEPISFFFLFYFAILSFSDGFTVTEEYLKVFRELI